MPNSSKSFFSFKAPSFLIKIGSAFKSFFKWLAQFLPSWLRSKPSKPVVDSEVQDGITNINESLTKKGIKSEIQEPVLIPKPKTLPPEQNQDASASTPTIETQSIKPDKTTAPEIQKTISEIKTASNYKPTSPPAKAPPLDEVDEHGMTALMRAVNNSDIKEARALLEKGANINQVNSKININHSDLVISKQANTALGMAVQNTDIEMIKLLLQYKANVKLSEPIPPDKNYWVFNTHSVLDFLPHGKYLGRLEEHAKALSEAKKIIFLLIANSDILHIVPINEFFFNVLEESHIPTVEHTLKYIRENPHNTPLPLEDIYMGKLISSHENHHRSIRFYNDPETQEYNYITYALKEKQTDMALFLLRNAMNDITDASKIETLLAETLVFASYYNNQAVIEFCLKHGSKTKYNEYIEESSGFTALMAAAYMGHLSVVKQLVENGCNVNQLTPGGISFGKDVKMETALNCAILKNTDTQEEADAQAEIIYYLLNKGAKFDSGTLKLLTRRSNLRLYSNRINGLIEFSDELGANIEPYYVRQIDALMEGINAHNRSKVESTLSAADKVPVVINKIISDYLYPRPASKSQKPDEPGDNQEEPSTNNNLNRPKT